jgi:hypothetical protein
MTPTDIMSKLLGKIEALNKDIDIALAENDKMNKED